MVSLAVFGDDDDEDDEDEEEEADGTRAGDVFLSWVCLESDAEVGVAVLRLASEGSSGMRGRKSWRSG